MRSELEMCRARLSEAERQVAERSSAASLAASQHDEARAQAHHQHCQLQLLTVRTALCGVIRRGWSNLAQQPLRPSQIYCSWPLFLNDLIRSGDLNNITISLGVKSLASWGCTIYFVSNVNCVKFYFILTGTSRKP